MDTYHTSLISGIIRVMLWTDAAEGVTRNGDEQGALAQVPFPYAVSL